MRSELGKGTDAEVIIPVEKSDNSKCDNTELDDRLRAKHSVEECITDLQRRAVGKSVCILREEESTQASRYKHVSWASIRSYCSEWFGLEIKETSADFVITDRHAPFNYADGQRVLIVHNDVGCSTRQEEFHGRYAIGHISSPIGPFKLSRSLVALLDQEIIPPQDGQKLMVKQTDAETQTPLGSPEERIIMNGIILTDYGFTQPPSLSRTADQPNTLEIKKGSVSNAKPTSWNAQQQQAGNQAFASINALSLQQLPTPASPSTTSASQTFPYFPSPTMKLKLPHNPKILTPPTDPATTPTSLHILAVDDNVLNLQLLHRYLLKRRGDTIVTARNGVEAVEAVRDGKGFDVVFMDISMPEMDGFEATRVIRGLERSQMKQAESHKDLSSLDEKAQLGIEEISGDIRDEIGKRAYIVALTGLASRRDRDMAQESGFDDFLTKPISFARIGELLKRLSEEKSRV
jgi:CheY-like chemotaxis protein